MNKLISIISMVGVAFVMITMLFVLGCSDKITRVTEVTEVYDTTINYNTYENHTYLNDYPSCVGIWSGNIYGRENTDTGMITIEAPVMLIFKPNGSWYKSSTNYHTRLVSIDSGSYYVQNVREIFTIGENYQRNRYLMLDSITITEVTSGSPKTILKRF